MFYERKMGKKLGKRKLCARTHTHIYIYIYTHIAALRLNFHEPLLTFNYRRKIVAAGALVRGSLGISHQTRTHVAAAAAAAAAL